MPAKSLLTPAEVAKQLDVTERKVSSLRYERKLDFIRIGNTIRFTQEQVDKFLESASVAAK